jgi:hypothetical protein
MLNILLQTGGVISDKVAELEPSQAILGLVLLAVVGAFLAFMLRRDSMAKQERDLAKQEREAVIKDNRSFINELSERHDVSMDKRDARLKEMAESFEAVQRESIQVIRENTRALAMYEQRRHNEANQS